MDRRALILISDDFPASDGIAPYAGSSRPGPLGFSSQKLDPWIEGGGRKPAQGADLPPLRLSFTLGLHVYRLRRVHEWHQVDEVPVLPYRAAQIIEEAIVEHNENPELVEQLQTAIVQLAGLHHNGTILVLRVEEYAGRAVVPVSEPARPGRRPPAPLQPREQEPVVGPDQAAALKDAAANGVPFCEECAKAAAAAAPAA